MVVEAAQVLLELQGELGSSYDEALILEEAWTMEALTKGALMMVA